MTIQRRTLFASLATVSAAALVLTGCSADDGADAESATPSAAMVQEIHDMLPESIRDAGVIQVGTEAFYPPHEYFAEDEETIIGVDPDIVYALGDILGVEMNLENMAWDGLLPALDAGRIDMIAAAMGVTEERVQKYDFVSYFNTVQGATVLAGNSNNISVAADLCGLNISVLDGSHQLDELEKFNAAECAGNEMTVMPFPADSDALQQLQNGRADAHIAQFPAASYNAETFGGGDTFEALPMDDLAPQILALSLAKDSTELRDALQAAMNELIDSGLYAEILAEHGLESGAIVESEINPLI